MVIIDFDDEGVWWGVLSLVVELCCWERLLVVVGVCDVCDVVILWLVVVVDEFVVLLVENFDFGVVFIDIVVCG